MVFFFRIVSSFLGRIATAIKRRGRVGGTGAQRRPEGAILRSGGAGDRPAIFAGRHEARFSRENATLFAFETSGAPLPVFRARLVSDGVPDPAHGDAPAAEFAAARYAGRWFALCVRTVPASRWL